jgi:excisionase family DNA binding protein
VSVSRVLSQAEVARRLGVTPRTLRSWIKSGRIVPWFTDDNGRHVFTEATLEADQLRAGQLAAERRSA